MSVDTTAPSVEVPTLRMSERAAFKRCQMKWKWGIIDGLRPKGPPSPALWFGIGMHLCFAEWYKPGMYDSNTANRGREPQETWAQYCGDEIVQIKELIPKGVDGDEWEKQWHDARTLGDQMLKGYREKYGRDDRKNYIAPEQSFTLGIPRPGKREAIVNFASTFDGVFRDMEDEQIKLDEHKTAAIISTGHLSMDDQAGSYWMAADFVLHGAGLIPESDYIRGIEYNFLRKADPYADKRPVNAEGYRTNKPQKKHFAEAIAEHEYGTDSKFFDERVTELTKFSLPKLEAAAADYGLTVLGDVSATQPGEFFVRDFVERGRRERNTQITRMGNEALQMEAVRNGVLPVVKTPVAIGPTACHFGCDFFEMCELHELGGKDWEEYRDAMYTIHDPYAAYRHLKSA